MAVTTPALEMDSAPVPPVSAPTPTVSLVPSGSWSGFDPSVCGYTQPMMPGAMPAIWPPQPFPFPVPPPPPRPAVISAPPLLNANGLKRRTGKESLIINIFMVLFTLLLIHFTT